MHRIAITALTLALGLAPRLTSAQFGDFLKDRAKKAIDETAKEAIRGGNGKPERAEAPKHDAAEPAKKERPGDAADRAATGATAGGAAADEVAAGEVYGNRFDFVPGDKVLLYDDFSETGVGDYPARWTIKEGGGNPTEVVSYKAKKWWKSVPGEHGNDWSMHWLRYAAKGDFPQKFTIEFDADMGGKYSVVFSKQSSWGGQEIGFDHESIHTTNVRSAIKPYGSVVKHVSISVNGTYAKVYVGGVRVLQDPDAIVRPIARIGFRFDALHKSSHDPLEHQMMTGFRLAEGGKDLAQALNAEGRIVVHGITFDTGSDVIRPESGGALRAIQQLLEGEPALRFRIEGHTDDQGGPTVNGPLSERRAAAVKAWLVRQGIEAKRLDTQGLGATKPIDSNATQEGRANNRRVEFVRLAGVG